jgi:hypothetical protein
MPELIRLNIYSPLNGTVDRKTHIIHGASAIQAVEAKGHRAIVDMITLEQFVTIANSKAKGVKSRFTHPGLSSSGLGRFLGRFRNLQIIGNKAIGDLHLSESAANSPHGDLRGYIEELAIEDPTAFGMSAVILANKVWTLDNGAEVDAKNIKRPENATTKYPIFRIKDIRAVDAVDEPAANRDGMFSAALEGTNQLAEELFAQLDKLTANLPLTDLLDELERLHRGQELAHPALTTFMRQSLNATGQDNERAEIFAAQYIQSRQAKRQTRSRAAVSFTQIQLAAAENGTRKYRGRLIRAGYTRNVLNEKTNLFVPSDIIQQAVHTGQFEGLACFIDHVQPGDTPSMRNLFGTWHGASWQPQDQAAQATLTAYVTDDTKPLIDRLDQILGAESPAPDVGVSLVFYPEWKQTASGERHVNSFKQIESADIVFLPAADGRILEALSAQNQTEVKMSESVQTADKDQAVEQKEVQSPDVDKIVAFSSAIETEKAKEAKQQSDRWVDEVAQQGIQTILKNSGLPEIVRARLSRARYETPEEVYTAIQEAREELQALDAQEVVDLGDRPWIYTKDPQDNIQDHVDWFFGVEGAKTPPPNYRKIDQLYVALTGDTEFQGVFKPDKVMLASATTTTLANMAVDAMNKVIMLQMSRLDFWRWFERVAMPIPNDGSVQSMKLITYGGIGNLPTVTEGAAYTELTVDDVKETASFTKKGGYVGITIEMIRNSQIVEIQAVPRALATAAVRTRSAAVSTIFTSNSGVGPTLAQDSTALFHADHSNIATTALGTDATAWNAARAECFEHTEVHSGKSLAVFPRYILVPAELYDTALSIFGYGEGMPTSYQPQAQDRGPVDPRPIPLVVPDWTDATDWAYIVDPLVYPVIQISYAQAPGGGSHPAPELYTVTDENQGLIFTNDVMPIKVRDWFAVNVNGPRGIGKRNVA